MDEMEQKEGLEQEEKLEQPEETVEQEETTAAPEETAEQEETTAEQEETAEPETEPEQPEETAEPETTPAEKTTEKGNIIGLVIGFAAFIAVMVFCWMAPIGEVAADTGVLYAKGNNLYYYDMKNEPYLLQETIADDGTYHYFYSAWGANVSADNEEVYYAANIKADGTYDLYYKDVTKTDAKVKLVAKGVCDHIISENGEKTAYLVQEEDGLCLKVFDGENSTEASKEMQMEEDAYSISPDGKYLVYRDAYSILHAAKTDDLSNAIALTDDCPLYALAEDTLYFVSMSTSAYNIYAYDFKDAPKLVAENAVYMELMPNGRDVLYGIVPEGVVPYAELIADDMAEADAALTEADGEAYEAKQQRDQVREAMANGEGLTPILQEYYVISGGRATCVAENVISAVAAKGEKSFVTGYRAAEMEKIPMSALNGGLEMVEMLYYMSLSYGSPETFLVDAHGNSTVLGGYGIQPETIRISAHGTKAAYLAADETTGETILMELTIGKDAEATAVQTAVDDFAFVGDDLYYYFGYADGVGTLAKAGIEEVVENACGVEYAEDCVYYITNLDAAGCGELQSWNGKKKETIDSEVFSFQYKGNGKAAILTAYDANAGVGNLHYYDGKNVHQLDEGITAIFMY